MNLTEEKQNFFLEFSQRKANNISIPTWMLILAEEIKRVKGFDEWDQLFNAINTTKNEQQDVGVGQNKKVEDGLFTFITEGVLLR